MDHFAATGDKCRRAGDLSVFDGLRDQVIDRPELGRVESRLAGIAAW
jgi:hypothetical protein